MASDSEIEASRKGGSRANQQLMLELKQQRGCIKAKLTRFTKFLNDPSKTDDFLQVELRLNKIDNVLNEFEAIQNKIDAVSKDNDSDAEISEFENLYWAEVTRAQRILCKTHSSDAILTASQLRTTQPDSESRIQIRNEALNIKLPEIQLPPFHGDFDSWLGFHDLFTAVIHEEERLSHIQKLHYLRSCLRGDAAKVIESLETSSENYEVAWNLLKERFHNTRIIIQNHLNTFLALPYNTKESAINMRTLVDKIQSHLRALKALGEPVDAWSSLLIAIITSKLDNHTRREWEKTITGKNMPKMQALLDFLQKRCEVLESTASDHSNKPQLNTQLQSSRFNVPKKQSLATTRSTDHCNLCKGEHKIYMCERLLQLSIPERYEALKPLGVCFNCLRKGHISKNCTASACKKCKKKHNTLLHLDSAPIDTTQRSCLAKSLQAYTQKEVLLSTAIVNFIDKTNYKRQARVILDSGSQSNFITEKFATLLGMTRKSIEIPVEGLNQVETRIKQSIHAHIASKLTSFTAELEFLVIPQICDVLPSVFIHWKNLKIPKNIRLANPEFD